MLENGAKPDNCMFAIAWRDDPEGAALFIRHGAKITDARGTHGPFLAAVNWAKLRVARWFLENGAHPNAQDDKGHTALHLAVKKNLKASFVNLLLSYGADPKLENNEGVSAFSLAGQTAKRRLKDLFTGDSQQ